MTRHLADTHVLLWAAGDQGRLSQAVRALLVDAESAVYFSMASVWEIAIKIGLRKLRLETPLPAFVQSLSARGFLGLPVRVAHAARIPDLPMHHRDPFDRMLIAQALAENMTIVTSDGSFGKYGVKVLW